MVCTSNPLIENTSSAEGTSAGGTSAGGTSAGGTSAEGTSAKTQHKESTETDVRKNKIKTIVVPTEEKNTRKYEIFYEHTSSSVVKHH